MALREGDAPAESDAVDVADTVPVGVFVAVVERVVVLGGVADGDAYEMSLMLPRAAT